MTVDENVSMVPSLSPESQKNAPKAAPKSVGLERQKLFGLFNQSWTVARFFFGKIHFLFGSESSLISLAVVCRE